MNFGQLIRHGLNKAEMNVNNLGELALARQEANEVISMYWYKFKPNFRKDSATISTVASTGTYLLDKSYDEMVRHSFRGPSGNPRRLSYLDPVAFYRKVNDNDTTTGYPLYWTYNKQLGVDADLTSGSVIKISSSLASVTTGTVKVTDGMRDITFSIGVLTPQSVGLKFLVDSDTRYYQIGEYISSTRARLTERFRGASNTTAGYTIGDIGIEVIISGVVGGQDDTETLILNGDSVVTGAKTFTSVKEITKGETQGRVTVTNSAADETLATFAPAELEIERVQVKLWPTPSSVEVLTYDFMKHHPILRYDADRILFPRRHHALLKAELEIRLKDWAEKPISPDLRSTRDTLENDFVRDVNGLGLETVVQKEEGASSFGDQYYYDHDEDLG